MSRVAILGGGSWGTAIAAVLARGGHQASIWTVEPDVALDLRQNRRNSKYLPDIELPPGAVAHTDLAPALAGAEFVVWAVPVAVLRSVALQVSSQLPPGAVLVSLAKGLERGTHARPTQVLGEALPGQAVAALLGPSHAEEVARGVPTTVAACSDDAACARTTQALFHGERFRVYTNDDLPGSEYGTALKNVIAVAAGISDGLGFGDNTKGALVTRGLAEMSRLGVALGGRKETFFGLTGLGDLVTTAFSRWSRNRHVGEELGRGVPLATVLGSMTQVAEGVPTSRVALELARDRKVDVPIIEQVTAVLFESKPPRDALLDLLARDPRRE
ncbi:MAG TPA: NAD(P)H-dependent glycerol-3-phosphate dehydrogenase [Candidatus Eisenbacteria bacterium]|jgi:glycerol-3-phosphate dehydrogenase (NAD(P)+)|nr:NAD(P)H-dependent glycerol-3-phosphate dehydrogenase [Candidatus Eisenbacteria bacterium]